MEDYSFWIAVGFFTALVIVYIVYERKKTKIYSDHVKDMEELRKNHNAKMDTLSKELDRMLEEE
jgi:hypothetical protein